MLVDKQSELRSDLLFTVHQHGGDDETWKSPITALGSNEGYQNRNHIITNTVFSCLKKIKKKKQQENKTKTLDLFFSINLLTFSAVVWMSM